MEEVATFNPLSILDPASEHFADDIAYLADSVIISQGKDPHWDDSARELVAGLIAYTVTKYEDEASLPLVRLLLTKPFEEIAGMAQEAQSFGAYHVAARKLGRFVKDSKELGSIISTALTQTAFLDSETLAKNMKESSFSFEDVVAGEATIYLVLPVDKLQTYGRWLRLMVSIGIRTIARNTRELPNPVLFFLDEFGTIGKLSAVSQAVGLMAGLQMCIWVFIQDLIQLKRDYPNEWETFIANAGYVSAFNVMDQMTAEYISKMLGQTTVERISQLTADKRKSNPNYGAMTDQEFSRPLLTADEVRTSCRGFLLSNYDPIVFSKSNYFDERFFAEKARHNPLYERKDAEHFDRLEEERDARDYEREKRKSKHFSGGFGFWGFVKKHPYMMAIFAGWLGTVILPTDLSYWPAQWFFWLGLLSSTFCALTWVFRFFFVVPKMPKKKKPVKKESVAALSAEEEEARENPVWLAYQAELQKVMEIKGDIPQDIENRCRAIEALFNKGTTKAEVEPLIDDLRLALSGETKKEERPQAAEKSAIPAAVKKEKPEGVKITPPAFKPTSKNLSFDNGGSFNGVVASCVYIQAGDVGKI